MLTQGIVPAGAGLFIGTCVVGCVLRAGEGAAMRGALIRDVSSYALAVAAVGLIVASGQVLGRCSRKALLLRDPGSGALCSEYSVPTSCLRAWLVCDFTLCQVCSPSCRS